MSSELERIARLAARFTSAPDASILRAIGDDAAVLDPGARGGQGARLVWTVDAHVEGVHFRADLVSWRDVGWRSFMAAASDCAAMGASPWCALSALVLPRGFSDAALDELSAGQAEAGAAVGSPIVGGNLSSGSEVSITTTLLGTAARPLERVAREGDGLWVCGAIGSAAAGLAALERGFDPADAQVAPLVLAWRRPRARIAEGVALASLDGAHGAIDVSDGLARDVGHVARASGLRAVLAEDALRAYVEPSLASISARLGAAALDLALYGGEDYALVASSASLVPGFACLGRFEKGEGVAIADAHGRSRLLDVRGGYDHFA